MLVSFDIINGAAPIHMNARCLPKPCQNNFQSLRARVRVDVLFREVQQRFMRYFYLVRRRQKFFGKYSALVVALSDFDLMRRLVVFDPTQTAFETYRHAEILQ